MIKVIKSDQAYEISWKDYNYWYQCIDNSCSANQSLGREIFEEYKSNKMIIKLILKDEDNYVGIIFLAREPRICKFYNPDYFIGDKFDKALYIPRGGLALDPKYWNDKLKMSNLLESVVEASDCNRFVIDFSDDGLIGPYTIFPQEEVLDKMLGVGWQSSRCKTDYCFQGNMSIVNIKNGDSHNELLEKTWNVFVEGFDNAYLSPCPPVFDFDYYQSIYKDENIFKTFLFNGDEAIGAVVSMPIQYIDFVNINKISKMFNNNIYFVLEMTIIKKYRKFENLIKLGRAFVKNLPENITLVMDHSLNLNEGFCLAIQRTYKLQSSEIAYVGSQVYKLIQIL